MKMRTKTTSLLVVAAIAAAAVLATAQVLTPSAYAFEQNSYGGDGGTGGTGGTAENSLFGTNDASGGDANGGNGGTNNGACTFVFTC